MNYLVKAVWKKGDGHAWVVEDLKSTPDAEGIMHEDSVLYTIGMYNVCDTVRGVKDAIHAALYDERQGNGNLKEGDEFHVRAATVNKYLGCDSWKGRLRIPAMKFKCVGVHVTKV
ncbi:hypothetical protein LCGC14_0614550 [marine sediment metagenome]|uniref:Uncharacterized protein n=1 Tax=marine sediment metagenome TaxID=412755 RepID=A0A0F9R6Q1_9ZZZZ